MAARPLALVSADWHLRKYDRVWYRRDTLRGDAAWGVRQVCDIAAEQMPDCLILLGDLFDQRLQQSDSLMLMRRAMADFQENNIQVQFIQGQHERSSPTLMKSIHSWSQHIDERMVELDNGNLLMYGLDYRNPVEVEEALRAVPTNADILATHQVWKDYLGEERGDAWFHWAPTQFIATGDFHKAKFETRGTQKILSPGPLCMQNIGEDHEKFVFMLNSDLTVTPYKLRSRGYYEARLYEEAQLEQFLDEWDASPAKIPQVGVPPAVATNIIRVWYRSDIPDAKPRLEGRIGSSAHLFTTMIPVEDQAQTVDAERRVQAVLGAGMVGCINEFYGDDPRACADAVRLYRSKDIQTELLSIFKEQVSVPNGHREGTFQDETPGDPRSSDCTTDGRRASVGATAPQQGS